jgi:hypothetical protein
MKEIDPKVKAVIKQYFDNGGLVHNFMNDENLPQEVRDAYDAWLKEAEETNHMGMGDLKRAEEWLNDIKSGITDLDDLVFLLGVNDDHTKGIN